MTVRIKIDTSELDDEMRAELESYIGDDANPSDAPQWIKAIDFTGCEVDAGVLQKSRNGFKWYIVTTEALITALGEKAEPGLSEKFHAAGIVSVVFKRYQVIPLS